MRTRSLVVLSFVAVPMLACSHPPGGALPACEWCGAMDAPSGELPHAITIAGIDEPGERMVLRGRVFESDGETPAPGVLMYVYHTDARGIYRTDDEGLRGNGLRHGPLRGWLRTDETGRYEISTIRPGVYPSRIEAAHVHVTLTPEGGEEDWVESFFFEGDELLGEGVIRASERDGRFGAVVSLEPDADGVLMGERDLRIGWR